jgi:hypothetical protein
MCSSCIIEGHGRARGQEYQQEAERARQSASVPRPPSRWALSRLDRLFGEARAAPAESARR